MSDHIDEPSVQALRSQALAAQPEVRAAAVRELLSRDLERPRDTLLGVLLAAGWPERRLILEHLARRIPRCRADAVLALLDSAAGPGAPTPGGRDAAELEARLHAELATVFLRLKDPARARHACGRACELAPAGLSHARGLALHQLGRALRRERAWGPARQALKSSLEQYERLDDQRARARVLDTLGNLSVDIIDLEEAEHYYRTSLQLKVEHGDLDGQALTCGHLGRIAALRGEHQRALEYFYKDLRLASQLGDAHEQAISTNHLALTYLALGDHERAVRLVKEGLDAARRSDHPHDLAHSDRVFGRIALERDDLEAAGTHLAAALAAFEAHDAPWEVAHTRLLVGALDRRRKRLDIAAAALVEARGAFQTLGDRAGEAMACLELSLVHQARGDEAAQSAMLREGRALATTLGRTTIRRDLHRMQAHLEAGRGLLASGVADAAQLEELIERSYLTGHGLGRLLLARRILDERGLESFLREKAGIARASEGALAGPRVSEALKRLPQGMAERLRLLPIELDDRRLVVATADPLDFQVLEQVELATGWDVRALYAPEALVTALLARALAGPRLGLERAANGQEAFAQLLEHAARMGASDIHVEPKRESFAVRVRVDGVLQQVDRLSIDLGRRLVAHVKAVAGMDIAERRRPQDGRLRGEYDRQELPLRLSTLPTTHGEKLVARLLGRAAELDLAELGFDASTVSSLKRLAARQEGLVAVVGPTGSGKSTTLAALLQTLDSVGRAVYTVEDPVEFELATFTQTQIDGGVGLDFAEALRALLRQDPNVILLGEMRDLESASIATRMALTGHLVFTTLHTYDATTSVTRLLQMGLPAFSVAAVVKAVLAQRLVRRLCPHCRVAEPIDRQWMRSLDPQGDQSELLENASVYGPKGCERCHGLGYRGRLPVYELLEIDGRIATLIRNGAAEEEIGRAARTHGMATIQASALRRVAAGETSQAEILRVL